MRNPVLAGQRIYLRPIEPADSEVVAEIDASEDELHIDEGPRGAFSTMAYKAWIEQVSAETLPGRIEFAVCLKEDDLCIGFVGLGDINWVHRSASTFAIFRSGAYRGKGYGTEAKHLVLEFAFDHIGLHTLVSWIWGRNDRSVAAILKQGYKSAGVLKFDAIDQGSYYDFLVFDVLREDWLVAREIWRANLPRRESERSGGA